MIPEVNPFAIIADYINEFKTSKQPEYRRYMNYYTANHPILNRTMEEGKANTRLVFQFPKFIIDTAHSYLVGKPITYANNTSIEDLSFADTDEFIKTLRDIFANNDESFLTAEILKNCSIVGDAYEYIYLKKDGTIKMMEFPASECIPIYNPSTKELEAVIRFFEMEKLDANGKKKIVHKIEVYDNEKVTYYDMEDGKVTLDLTKPATPHKLEEVPIIHYKNVTISNMDYGLSDIKDVETLIDEFNERASDLSNTLQYNSNPLLKLINCTMDKEQLQEMINSRCIQLPEGAQAEYLVWDQQINAIEKHLERLNDCILTFSCTPKLYKDNDEGNPMSGISIKMKFSGADLKANNKERNYRLGIKKRIRLISKILALTENKVYNYNDVDIIFNRSIPQNLLELADIVVKLKGTVSDETLLGILPFVIDVTTEMDRVAKEKLKVDNETDTTQPNTDQVK